MFPNLCYIVSFFRQQLGRVFPLSTVGAPPRGVRDTHHIHKWVHGQEFMGENCVQKRQFREIEQKIGDTKECSHGFDEKIDQKFEQNFKFIVLQMKS
ncbi:hypothetical protein [Rhizobium sp.]|jgi:hypothetical protein|uniref:hypothetical protein n=1 Tax=Rhizobium sp. TaxID=391 RepID=UPI002AA8F593